MTHEEFIDEINRTEAKIRLGYIIRYILWYASPILFIIVLLVGAVMSYHEDVSNKIEHLEYEGHSYLKFNGGVCHDGGCQCRKQIFLPVGGNNSPSLHPEIEYRSDL